MKRLIIMGLVGWICSFCSTFIVLSMTEPHPLWLANQKAAEFAYEEKLRFLESEERMFLTILKDRPVKKWEWNCVGQQEVLNILEKTGYIKQDEEFWTLVKR